MKRLTLSLAPILCLVLCVFAFASCGQDTDKKPASSTTASGACAHEWGEYFLEVNATCSNVGMKVRYCKKCEAPDPDVIEIPKLAHTESTEYKTLSEPTCKDPGYKTKFCTVCGANLDETIESIPADSTKHKVSTWTVTEEATLFNGEGSRSGNCDYCGQGFKESYSSIVEQKYTTDPLEERLIVEQNIYTELLNSGEKHFYPDDSNGGTGLDLYVEYSFLWNNTFENLGSGTSENKKHPIIDTRLSSSANDKGTGNDLTWMALKNNASGSDCPFAGGFEYGSLRTVEVGPHGMSTTKAKNEASGTTYADFPNIGGTDQANPEWGWHRVGVRFHQELTNENEVKTSNAAATYRLYVETYIDGALVSRLSNAETNEFGESTKIVANLLFTAESDGNGGITYKDGGDGCYIAGIRLPFDKTEKDAAYVVYADYYATAGTGFVQNVSRVASPAANEYTTADGTKIPAPIYYTINP